MDRTGYDPEWVELEKAMGSPSLPEDQDARREAFNAILMALSLQLSPTDPRVQSRDVQISPDVKVRIYTPPNASGSKLPVIVFAHGGGWQSGNLDTEDHMCRTICAQLPCVMVSVEYRVFPSVKFPTPIDECYMAFQWAYDNADNMGADQARYFIWGGSAGAALAVAVTYKLVSSGQKNRIAGLISMAGMIVHPDAVPENYKHLHKSYDENSGQVPVVTGDMMLWAFEHIVGLEGAKDVNWFPVVGGMDAVRNFPRTYIINTEKEALRDDGAVLEAELNDAGIAVKRDVLSGLPHYFWCFPIQKAGARFRETLLEGIKWLVGNT